MEIVRLVEEASRETIETLETLLRAAKKGHIRGLLYVCDYRTKVEPIMGATDRYSRNWLEAIGATSYLLRELHLAHEERAAR